MVHGSKLLFEHGDLVLEVLSNSYTRLESSDLRLKALNLYLLTTEAMLSIIQHLWLLERLQEVWSVHCWLGLWRPCLHIRYVFIVQIVVHLRCYWHRRIRLWTLWYIVPHGQFAIALALSELCRGVASPHCCLILRDFLDLSAWGRRRCRSSSSHDRIFQLVCSDATGWLD